MSARPPAQDEPKASHDRFGPPTSREVHIGVWTGPARLGQVVLRGLSAGSASLADSLYQRFLDARRERGPGLQPHIVLDPLQSAYVLRKLEAAEPPNETERHERQRQLFANASTVELHSSRGLSRPQRKTRPKG